MYAVSPAWQMTEHLDVSTVGDVSGSGRQWVVRGVPAGDVALAGVLALFATLDVLLSPDWRGPWAVNVIVVPLMALSVGWRRKSPLIPLASVTVGVAALGVAYGSSQTWTGIFLVAVVVYSAAAHSAHLAAVAALTVAVAAAHVAFDPQVVTFGDALWTSTLAGLTLLAGVSGRSIGNRAQTLDALAAQLERDEEQRAAAAAAEERRRIARELHDIISHSLGVLVLQAGAAEQSLERDPNQVRQVLQSMRRTGQEAIGEMSTLLGLIRTEPEATRAPHLSLNDLDDLVATTRAAGLPVALDVTTGRRPLPAALELSAYRVVQEAITNVLKHAPGANTRITVHHGDHQLDVEVINDAPENSLDSSPGSRQGLAGLAERLAVFGGRLDAGPRPGGGWVVRAAFPLAS